MKTIELRLDPVAVKPLISHLREMVDDFSGELATSAVPPEEDELMSEIWQNDLLRSQNSDLVAIVNLFDETFLDTGRARVTEENADNILRGCSAIRLRLREITLEALNDEALEGGQIEFEAMSEEQRIGYGAYALLASLQEIVITQLYGDE